MKTKICHIVTSRQFTLTKLRVVEVEIKAPIEYVFDLSKKYMEYINKDIFMLCYFVCACMHCVRVYVLSVYAYSPCCVCV